MLLTPTEQINITLEKSSPLSLLYITTLLSKELCLAMWNAGSKWLDVKYEFINLPVCFRCCILN